MDAPRSAELELMYDPMVMGTHDPQMVFECERDDDYLTINIPRSLFEQLGEGSPFFLSDTELVVVIKRKLAESHSTIGPVVSDPWEGE